MLVARGADRGDGFVTRSVRRLHVTMAFGASAGFGLGIVVRPVTLHAGARAVDLDAGCGTLLLSVAAHAICGGESLGATGIRHAMSRSLGRECVASRAVRFRIRTKTFRRRIRSVFESTFLFMARLAALGSHVAQDIVRELVTLGARDLLLDHVHIVTTHGTCALPRGRNVDALAVRPGRTALQTGIRARGHGRDDQRNKEPREREGPNRASQRAT